MNPQPSYINVIAQGGGIKVLEYNGEYHIKGLASHTIVFHDENEWNLFMAVMQIADARINGVEE
ncbi:MAG: hypothetical protein IJT54_04050 [Candidatus Methanomethylophilaceae archaeon]|nr:hypothetical protein [Candidatus Methanomethylophilaceae archaeon]